MGLGLSRSQEQNPVEENDVPENPIVPDNANIQRHLNPEINLRRNNTGIFAGFPGLFLDNIDLQKLI